MDGPILEIRNLSKTYKGGTVALEGFKGDQLDWRTENSAKNWATAYDFPAANDKRVILEEFEIRNFGIMQAFAFNIRRDKFKDPRVRFDQPVEALRIESGVIAREVFERRHDRHAIALASGQALDEIGQHGGARHARKT